MYDSFISLSLEKQSQIISAGFYCFGKLGYKKTSASNIAQEANISKAMVFHYFGNKKGLYVYLMNYACDLMENEIKNQHDLNNHDFFDYILLDIQVKENLLKQQPHLLLFMASLLQETDLEVIEEIQKLKERGLDFHQTNYLNTVDYSKFKTDVDPQLVLDLITSYVTTITQNTHSDLENSFNKIYTCINMLRNNLYKQEYVTGSDSK